MQRELTKACRWTPEEWAEVEQLSMALKQKPSEYVRQSALMRSEQIRAKYYIQPKGGSL